MHRLVLLSLLLTPFTLPAAVGAGHVYAAPALQPASACTVTGYTRNCSGCAKIGSSGKFTLTVPHAGLKFKGSGAPASSKTTVCVSRVPAPRPGAGNIGVRVTATGKFSPLHVAGMKILRFVKRTGKLKKVPAIDRPGIYQIEKG